MDHIMLSIHFDLMSVQTEINGPWCQWNPTTIKRMCRQWKPGPFSSLSWAWKWGYNVHSGPQILARILVHIWLYLITVAATSLQHIVYSPVFHLHTSEILCHFQNKIFLWYVNSETLFCLHLGLDNLIIKINVCWFYFWLLTVNKLHT